MTRNQMTYVEQLIANAAAAQEAADKPVKRYTIYKGDRWDYNPNSKNSSIYTVWATQTENYPNPESIFEAMAEYKKTKQRSCPKVNSPNWCLYVGSCITNLKRRINDHLGYGNELTSALQLSHWYYGFWKIEVCEYNTSKEIIQIIEDSLAYDLKPAFGKRGPNNK